MTKDELRKALEEGKQLDELFEFTDGQECQIFKAKCVAHFAGNHEIVYIPDTDLNEIDTDRVLASMPEIECVLMFCFTGHDFFEICGCNEKMARRVFDACDWQCPDTEYDEQQREEEEDPFAELEGWESLDQIQEAYGYGEITSDRRDKLTDLWEARETAQRKGKKDGKYHDLVTDMLTRAIHSVGIEYADEIAAYEEERRMRRSYYEKVENRANGLQEEEPEEPEEEPDPLSPARAAIATAMQAAKVSEVTGAPLPKPLTWKRGFYDTTRTFPSGWYECPVCGCRADWEPEQCPKCYTRLEPEETEG